MKATISVTLKEDVLDAPGRVVTSRLQAMGYSEVKSARVGKIIVLDIDAGDRENAVRRIEEMCGALLANQTIEEVQVMNIE